MRTEADVVVPPFLQEFEDESPAEGPAARDLVGLFLRQLERPETRGGSPLDSRGRVSGAEVLLSRVEAAPLKYAPFYRRVSEMLGIEESEVERLLMPTGFRRSPLPGIKYKEAVCRNAKRGQSATIVSFAPGTNYPRHRHGHDEKLLVLEGGYTDSSGRVYQAGDLHEMSAGSSHGFRVHDDSKCVAVALADKQIQFTSPWLRFLARLIGR